MGGVGMLIVDRSPGGCVAVPSEIRRVRPGTVLDDNITFEWESTTGRLFAAKLLRPDLHLPPCPKPAPPRL